MARWRQVIDENGKSVFVPLDEAAAKIDGVELSEVSSVRSHYVRGDIEPFVSTVDGTVIGSRKQLEEHNRRHNVVNTKEFEADWEKARRKREAHYTGERSRAERLEVRREIYENMVRAEREHGY